MLNGGTAEQTSQQATPAGSGEDDLLHDLLIRFFHAPRSEAGRIAFDVIVDECRDVVVSLLRRTRGLSWDDALDVAQEVFFDLWRKPDCFDPARVPPGRSLTPAFWAWLGKVARNRASDLLDKGGNRKDREKRHGEEWERHAAPLDPADVVLEDERLERLRHLMQEFRATLPDERDRCCLDLMLNLGPKFPLEVLQEEWGASSATASRIRKQHVLPALRAFLRERAPELLNE
jgi:RNA polymerase sigma factor (sigma-70 family)